MNRVPHCAECKRCQCTDFIYKDYYCCEENDTMRIFGRLGVDHPPKTSPKWCPLRENEQIFCSAYNPMLGFGNGENDCVFTEKPIQSLHKPKKEISAGDIIQMDIDTSLRDKVGNPIEIKVPEPEYISDSIF